MTTQIYNLTAKIGEFLEKEFKKYPFETIQVIIVKNSNSVVRFFKVEEKEKKICSTKKELKN